MNRREFITLAGGAGLSAFAARAEPPAKVPRIGWIGFLPSDTPFVRELREAFRQGLAEHGYVEGRDVVIEYRSAEGKLERQVELAAELVGLPVDLIIAGNTAAVRAARQATTTIPIVCFNLGDPVREGFVASLARPGDNVTGFSILAPELVPKQLALLKEAAPATARIAGLLQPGVLLERTAAEMLERAQGAARLLGVEFAVLPVASPADIDGAFEQMEMEQRDALLILPSPLSLVERQRIMERALRQRLPSVGWIREFVQAGGLLSYGANFKDHYRRGAGYVDRLLKGASIAELPVQQPTTFELVIHAGTARALGLALSPTLLALADEILE
jgi:putative ABC transport system substrate-binding protein